MTSDAVPMVRGRYWGARRDYHAIVRTAERDTESPDSPISGSEANRRAVARHAQATTVKLDRNENLRPAKDRETGGINGIVALFMALSRAIRRQESGGYPRPIILEG